MGAEGLGEIAFGFMHTGTELRRQAGLSCNEQRRDVDVSARQRFVHFHPAHAGHLNIRNQAVCLRRSAGFKKGTGTVVGDYPVTVRTQQTVQ
ncbi:hypothetical protein D3C80_1773680 [compost metagenome]